MILEKLKHIICTGGPGTGKHTLAAAMVLPLSKAGFPVQLQAQYQKDFWIDLENGKKPVVLWDELFTKNPGNHIHIHPLSLEEAELVLTNKDKVPDGTLIIHCGSQNSTGMTCFYKDGIIIEFSSDRNQAQSIEIFHRIQAIVDADKLKNKHLGQDSSPTRTGL